MRSLGEGLRLVAWSLALVALPCLACCASGPKAPPRIAGSNDELQVVFAAARTGEQTARKEALAAQDWEDALAVAKKLVTDQLSMPGVSRDPSPLLLTKIGDLALLEADLPGLKESERAARFDEADRCYQQAIDAYLGWSPALIGRARVARARGGEGALGEAANFLEMARDMALPMLREDLGLEGGAAADPFASVDADKEVTDARRDMSTALELYESWPADSLAPSVEFGMKTGLGSNALADRLEARIAYEQGLLAVQTGQDPTRLFGRAIELDEGFLSAKLQIAGWHLARSRDLGDEAALEQLKFAEMRLLKFISCEGQPAVHRDLPALQLLASIYVEQMRRGGPRQFDCAQQIVDEMNTRFPNLAEGALFAAELKLGLAQVAEDRGPEWRNMLLDAEKEVNNAELRQGAEAQTAWRKDLVGRIQRARGS